MARFWHDLRVLVVLGVTLLGSISVSVLATGALDVGLARLGLADGGWSAVRHRPPRRWCSGWAPASSSSTGCSPGFRAPRSRAGARSARRVVGALGFEVLKQATALSIGSVTGTPGGAVFGPLLGLLLFCYLVARFTLLLTAWAATARGNELPSAPAAEPAVPAPAGPESRRPVPAIPSRSASSRPPRCRCRLPSVPAPPPAGRAVSRGALGAALGVGMLLGAWLRGPRRPRDPAP